MEYSLRSLGATQCDIYHVHEEMSLAWSMDPRRDVREDIDGWTSDERPPWDPKWNDFMVDIPYDMYIPVYQLLFPGSTVPSISDMREIPLTAHHIKVVKEFADTMAEDEGPLIDIDPREDSMVERIHHLEPRILFQDEEYDEELRERRLIDCRRGFSIIEESMAADTCLSEGQYLELADIFKRLV